MLFFDRKLGAYYPSTWSRVEFTKQESSTSRVKLFGVSFACIVFTLMVVFIFLKRQCQGCIASEFYAALY